jgi:hypothetical protein
MIPDFSYEGNPVSGKKTIIRTDLPENIYIALCRPLVWKRLFAVIPAVSREQKFRKV